MNKLKNLFLFWSLLAFTPQIVYADFLLGAVTNIENGKTVKFRTATKDYEIDLDKLDPKNKAIVESEDAKKTIVSLDVPKEAILKEDTSSVRMGIRADCSELPVGIGDLDKLAMSSSNQLDFLQKIPEGSLQGFTFITNSLSLHRGKKEPENFFSSIARGLGFKKGDPTGQVSDMWPRVIRSSMDGKLNVSFVCDPKNPQYGKIEILYFDDKTKEFKTTEYDFGQDNKPNPPEDRVHHDPSSCVSCHAGSTINGKVSLKPVWPEYFFWSDCKEDRGIRMYGTSDDNMGPTAYRNRSSGNKKTPEGCNYEEDYKSVEKEKYNFGKFKELQANNPCFNSLPWPKDKDAPKAKYYPYAEDAQKRDENNIQDYSLRTNLRYTDTFSHLMSQQIARKLEESPDFEKVKYYLVMEEAGCIGVEDMKVISNLLPNLKIEKSYKSKFDWQRPLLYSYAKNIGLQNQDWTMEFLEKNNPEYTSAMPNSRYLPDLYIYNVVGGEVLKRIAEKNPALSPEVNKSLSRGITSQFGPRFSCIDDMGGGVFDNTGELCKQLRKANDEHLKQYLNPVAECTDCLEKKEQTTQEELKLEADKAVKKYSQEQVERGKKLVQEEGKGKCVQCHTPSVDDLPMELRFVASDSDPKKGEAEAILKSRGPTLIQRIGEKLFKDRDMPPMENDMTDQDREDIMAYMKSFLSQEEK